MSCWIVADMVVRDGARWTVRHDAAGPEVTEGWNLWRHRFDNPDEMRGGADLIESFGADRAAAIAAAHRRPEALPVESLLGPSPGPPRMRSWNARCER